MQAGQVLPRTRWLKPRRELASPPPRTCIPEADDAALPAGPAAPQAHASSLAARDMILHVDERGVANHVVPIEAKGIS
jgi:hypothetical protein